ncbi:hypothetical protein D3C77_732690 [compost metagenome]
MFVVVMTISSQTGAIATAPATGSAHVDVRGDFEAQTQIAEIGIDPLHGKSPQVFTGGQDVAARN